MNRARVIESQRIGLQGSSSAFADDSCTVEQNATKLAMRSPFGPIAELKSAYENGVRAIMNARYDVILIHAPSVYDFRDRDDVLFAYLSNSDGAHVSPIFEMPPVGIFALLQHLQKNGFSAQFFNAASQMLRDPAFNVETFFERVPASFIGIDLYWLVHAHGALELTRLYKEIHPVQRRS